MGITLRFALAQQDFCVGAVDDNAAAAVALAACAREAGARLVAFPELALSGYPADDLLLRPGFLDACDTAMADVARETRGIDVLIGHPTRGPRVEHTADEHAFQRPLLNAASVLRDGAEIARYAKHALPDYGVFDEKRYFTPGTDSRVLEIDGVRVGLMICEDIWVDAPAAAACSAGAQMLLVINASPYGSAKQDERLAVVQRQARRHGVGIAYLNGTGGQDDLLFDGASMLVDADGRLAAQAPAFQDHLLLAEYDAASGRFSADDWPPADACDDAVLYAGLVRGIRDYVRKNGFEGVLLGLSGGIDSALTLALAVDALGADAVTAVMMRSAYTSQLSLDGAREQAERQGVDYQVLSIESAFEAMQATLQPLFKGKDADSTEENLQSRLRGTLLMALSNKHGRLLLATGNKSEMAVGYATLYGDMCGAYAPLKDVYKTRVYGLARWRNEAGTRDPGPGSRGSGEAVDGLRAEASNNGRAERNGATNCGPRWVIPPAVIERPPSAELRAGQTDQDSLPAYDTLDRILEMFVEGAQSQEEIIAAGFDADTVNRVARLVLANEFKRRQSAPGPKVTRCAFGRERRYPITSGWS